MTEVPVINLVADSNIGVLTSDLVLPLIFEAFFKKKDSSPKGYLYE